MHSSRVLLYRACFFMEFAIFVPIDADIIVVTHYATFKYFMSSIPKKRSLSSTGSLRKWEKIVEPITRYDRMSSTLGCPLTFFAQLEQLIKKGHPLCLNIPITLSGAKDNCLRTVFENGADVGKISFTPSFQKSTFDQEVEIEMNQRLTHMAQKDRQFNSFYQKLCDSGAREQLLPLVVIKEALRTSSENCKLRKEAHSRTLSWDESRKLTHFETHYLAQSYIWGSSQRASIIRFFYFPSRQNSEAFKIDNVESLLKRRFGKEQFKVRDHVEGTLTFVRIMYSNKTFFRQAAGLCEYLEKHIRVKVSKLVTDWVLDPQGRYYLVDLKEAVYQQKQPSGPQRSLPDTLSYLTCSVCQQKYRPDQVARTLTNKLIIQFLSHINKRQISLSFRPSDHLTAGKARVCDLCYNLVVAEMELLELEGKLGKITHSIGQEGPSGCGWGQSTCHGPLYQWRLFLYLQKISDLRLMEGGVYYVMLRLHNSIWSYKLTETDECWRYEYLVKGIKIHYLFSKQPTIDQFLSSTQLMIRVTKGRNWNRVVAEGSSSGIYEQNQKPSMRKAKKILLFDADSKYSVAELHIGVKREGKIQNSLAQVPVPHNGVFFMKDYVNCYALPPEWMETIDPTYSATSASQSYSYPLKQRLHQKKKVVLPPNKGHLAL